MSAVVSAFNPATGQPAQVDLTGGAGDTPFLLTASVAVENSTSAPVLANCNFRELPFISFGSTSVTVPGDGTGVPASAHATLLGWVTLVPGEVKTIAVECHNATLASATISALRVGTLTVQP